MENRTDSELPSNPKTMNDEELYNRLDAIRQSLKEPIDPQRPGPDDRCPLCGLPLFAEARRRQVEGAK